jgi:hypothetical protein
MTDDDTLARIAEHRRLSEADRDRIWDELTWSLVDQPPRTIAGVAALLAYAVEYVTITGLEWPDNRSYFDDGEDVEWSRALLRALGSALAQ